MSVNTIRLKLASDTASADIIDSETNYGVVTIECDNEQKEAQNITTQVWYDENGEESYIPASGVKYKAYDYTMTLGVKEDSTNSARTRMETFIDFISGKLWYSIYQPYKGITLYGAYVSKVEDDDQGDDWITFKVTFHVTNPSNK